MTSSRAAVLLIDAQPHFWDTMAQPLEPVLAVTEALLRLACLMSMPVVATFEQPTTSNGWLPERLESVFPTDGVRVTKHYFDCMAEPHIRSVVADLDRRQLIVAGAATDGCVLLSVLGALALGYETFVLEDCVFGPEPAPTAAFTRMRAAGAIILTYRTLFSELAGRADDQLWARLKEGGASPLPLI